LCDFKGPEEINNICGETLRMVTTDTGCTVLGRAVRLIDCILGSGPHGPDAPRP